MKTTLKTKKCRICKAEFQPFSSTHVACGWQCAIACVEGAKAKKQRKALREDRERIKTRSEHLRDAQHAVNTFCRARDAGKPCISCGTYPNNDGLITGSRVDAGHYRSRGANPELRFEPLNIHLQCVRCNRQLSGNVVEFRKGLIERIGQEKLDWLEGHHEPTKYTIDEIKAIRAKYKLKLKELKE